MILLALIRVRKLAVARKITLYRLWLIILVDNIVKGKKSSEDLESVYDGIQSLETTGLDNSVNQDGTLTLRFIEKSNGDLAGVKNMNYEQ